jgi:hypothetical protein
VSQAAGTLLAALTLLSAGLWGDLPPLRAMRVRAGVVLTAATGGLGLAWLLAAHAPALTGWWVDLAAVLGVGCSVVAGGPVTTSLLRLADPGRPAGVPGPADPRVLRGGAWIGALERLAVTGAVLGGWPEAIALVLVLKGLGRYPELRAPAAAERFILGTLASVLWAVGTAGAATALIR